jgi:hypothetical protein
MSTQLSMQSMLTEATIPRRLRATIWLRSVILPDLSRWMPLERLLESYSPRVEAPAWGKLSAESILFHIDQHLKKCPRMRGRRCLRRGAHTCALLDHRRDHRGQSATRVVPRAFRLGQMKLNIIAPPATRTHISFLFIALPSRV